MNVIEVTGTSMRPFLVSGDILLAGEIQGKIPFSSLVVATDIHGERIVHRYLGPNTVKGDKIKQRDLIRSIDYVVAARVTKEATYSLSPHFLQKLIGFFSYLNQHSFTGLHYPCSLMITFLGKLARYGN